MASNWELDFPINKRRELHEAINGGHFLIDGKYTARISGVNLQFPTVWAMQKSNYSECYSWYAIERYVTSGKGFNFEKWS